MKFRICFIVIIQFVCIYQSEMEFKRKKKKKTPAIIFCWEDETGTVRSSRRLSFRGWCTALCRGRLSDHFYTPPQRILFLTSWAVQEYIFPSHSARCQQTALRTGLRWRIQRCQSRTSDWIEISLCIFRNWRRCKLPFRFCNRLQSCPCSNLHRSRILILLRLGGCFWFVRRTYCYQAQALQSRFLPNLRFLHLTWVRLCGCLLVVGDRGGVVLLKEPIYRVNDEDGFKTRGLDCVRISIRQRWV